MRKRTRRLRLRTETIAGASAPMIGRVSDHPEDTVKVLLLDGEEPDRGYVLELRVSQAADLARRLSEFCRG